MDHWLMPLSSSCPHRLPFICSGSIHFLHSCLINLSQTQTFCVLTFHWFHTGWILNPIASNPRSPQSVSYQWFLHSGTRQMFQQELPSSSPQPHMVLLPWRLCNSYCTNFGGSPTIISSILSHLHPTCSDSHIPPKHGPTHNDLPHSRIPATGQVVRVTF